MRGLERWFIALTTRTEQPLTILSSPDVAIPEAAFVGPASWLFIGDIISLLLIEDGGDEAQAAAAEIALQIATVGPYQFHDLSAGEPVFRPHFDRVARELASDPRHASRAWAALMLASLDRGPAPRELSRLLVDPIPDVRHAALNAVQDVDLREPRWVEDMLLQFFEVVRDEEAEFLPVMLTERLPENALEDLALLAETYLDANPGVPGPVLFLEAVRLRGIGRPVASRTGS